MVGVLSPEGVVTDILLGATGAVVSAGGVLLAPPPSSSESIDDVFDAPAKLASNVEYIILCATAECTTPVILTVIPSSFTCSWKGPLYGSPFYKSNNSR